MNREEDSFVKKIFVEVLEIHKSGIILQGNKYDEFYNVYGIAHGGYLYTLGHIAAQLTGDLCLGGNWDVQDAACQFLHPLRLFPARVETECISCSDDRPLVRISVHDANGKVCFQQNITLKEAEPLPEEAVKHTPKIFTDRPLPNDCYETPQFPCITSTFSRYLNIYSTQFQGSGLVYAVDLTEANCDDFGYVHPGAMFTAADAAAGGSLYYVEKKRPITVSGNIHYLKKTVHGPVSAVPKLIRGGRILFYYDVDIIDGTGECVAVAQFIIQHLDHK